MQTTEPGALHVKVMGVLTVALVGLAVRSVNGWTLTWVVACITCAPLPQVTV
jgi:hypothetical protein